ncbi:MAG TPA: extracellular solute-binding protein [Acidimicrobiales bacterium]|nr:extracellular solute-binding protein [Acidimicrobiales bacterium]
MVSTARIAASLTLVLATLAGAGCSSSESGTTTLTWYINPDNGGQATLAKTCTTAADGKYRIEIATLPNDADGQRQQLVRRLAAEDSSIDLMSLDPVFSPEFAEAGFLRPFDKATATDLTDGVLDAPVKAATWRDELVAAPFWANTQLLWYRKSVAARAGIDPATQPLTWDQVIKAAEQTDTTVEVQAKPYEGYMVLINALIVSAGGEVLADPDAGIDAKPSIDSEAGKKAAKIIRTLGRSSAADPQLSVSLEETARNGFQADNGGFMVNWPYVYGAAQAGVADGSLDQSVLDDIGWARYPRTVDGTESAPPLGGINLGVSAFTKHPQLVIDAVRCITSVKNQTVYMLAEGNPAARSAVYDDPEIQQKFPMATLIRDSIDTAGARPQTPYYPDVSTAITTTFSPPASVQPGRTPARADDLIVKVLHDEALI